jgi:hypothetical protein
MGFATTAINRTLDIGRSFEQFDLEASWQGFIGLKVLPHINVQIQAASFGEITLGSMLRDGDTTRGNRGNYNRGNWDFGDTPYVCVEHGWEEPVDRRMAAIYKNFFDAEMISAKKARDAVLRAYEKRVAAAIFSTATWTQQGSLATALTTAGALGAPVANKWSSVANATPQADVNQGCQIVYNNSGIRPNALVVDWTTYKCLQLVAAVQNLIKYDGMDDPKSITPNMLAALFDLEYVLIAGGRFNSAQEGQTASLSSIWANSMAWLGRIASTSGDAADITEPCVGRTIHYAEDGSDIGGVVESYYEEQSRAQIIRCRMDTAELVIYPQVGFLFTNIQ